MEAAGAYRIMTSAIVPRPIAFVSTVDANGVVNLAPFSFFNGVCSDPPLLMISITRQEDDSKKDTLRNIEFNGEFVVNSTHTWIAEEVNRSSENFPYGVSEMEKIGFHPLPSIFVRPPRIAEAWVNFECRLEKTVDVGDGNLGSSTIVIGRILAAHVANEAMTEGRIDYAKLQPLARLGGSQWLRDGTVFSMKRPK